MSVSLNLSSEVGSDDTNTKTEKEKKTNMPLYIVYFNLKDGVSEEEFVTLYKALVGSIEGKIEGLGSHPKLYRHHLIGAHPRRYQIHHEFNDFATWDRFLAFLAKDAEADKLFQEWNNLVDLNTHYDELVCEIPL